MDGLIKKRSLKNIYKLLIKMNKKFEKYGLQNLNMNKILKKNKKEENKNFNTKLKTGKSTNKMENKEKNNISFQEEIEIIKADIIKDINECNAKQEKDVIILIVLNIYNKNNSNSIIKVNKINAFIEETFIILNNYLSSYDRMGVLIYLNDYRIICPLIKVNKIDKENFSNDLNNFKNLYPEENNENEEINLNETKGININYDNIINDNSEDDSFSEEEKEEKNYDKIKGFVDTINYIINYFKMKEEVRNERYIILFTELINREVKLDEQVEKYFENLKGDKGIIFLLVGKNTKFSLKKKIENNDIFNSNNNIEELILKKFNEKSEIINFEHMKKIKTILSSNKVIKDKLYFPNEIYK